MAPGVAGLVEDMIRDGTVESIVNNPLAQFGRPTRQYLGATLLPNKTVEQNEFREDRIQYKTVIANDGTRYSPVQLKNGARTGSFLVELGENDIGSQMSSKDYDVLLKLIRRNLSMEGVAQITNWLDLTVTLALEEKIEVQRWEAIANAKVERRGDNGYRENVLYSNPAGHRVTIPGGTVADKAGLYDPTVDPFDAVDAGVSLLADKGYEVNRTITSRKVLLQMVRHPLVAKRLSRITLDAGGNAQGMAPRLNLNNLNEILAAEGLPGTIEQYNLSYFDTFGQSKKFLPEENFVMVATTGRDQDIGLDDDMITVPNTLGYAAIGRPAGQNRPGRATNIEVTRNKPPTIKCEGWQTQLPVIQDPEAIYVIKYLAPTP